MNEEISKRETTASLPSEADVLMLSHSVVTRNDMLLDYLGIYSFRYLTGFTVNHLESASLPILSSHTSKEVSMFRHLMSTERTGVPGSRLESIPLLGFSICNFLFLYTVIAAYFLLLVEI